MSEVHNVWLFEGGPGGWAAKAVHTKTVVGLELSDGCGRCRAELAIGGDGVPKVDQVPLELAHRLTSSGYTVILAHHIDGGARLRGRICRSS